MLLLMHAAFTINGVVHEETIRAVQILFTKLVECYIGVLSELALYLTGRRKNTTATTDTDTATSLMMVMMLLLLLLLLGLTWTPVYHC